MRAIGLLLALGLSLATVPVASAAKPAPRDYLSAAFETERVLDRGDRPNWSPDGTRLAFTDSDSTQGHAYVLDLASGDVDCLTCAFGAEGQVARIYHLSDGSYLIVGGGPHVLLTELYWMPRSAATAPQALGVAAWGEVAVSPVMTPTGGFRIAWSSAFTNGEIMTAELRHDGATATLTDRRVVARPPGQPEDAPGGRQGEPYDFSRDGRSLTYWAITAPADGEMYEVDLATGAVRYLYRHPSHNETHLFPGDQFGLEESNRDSDPDGPVRGVSGLLAGTGVAGGPFDLYVVSLADPTQVRRLTFASDAGGQANQSVPSPDGRRIAYVLAAPSGGESGLYVGTFDGTRRSRAGR